MRVWLNQRLLDAARQALRGVFPSQEERLQSEISGVDPESAVEVIGKVLDGWERQALLALFPHGNRDRGALLSGSDLVDLVRSAVESEEVVTIIDPVTLGGCLFTFSPEGDGTVEIYFSAWGSRAGSVQVVDNELGGDGPFYLAAQQVRPEP